AIERETFRMIEARCEDLELLDRDEGRRTFGGIGHGERWLCFQLQRANLHRAFGGGGGRIRQLLQAGAQQQPPAVGAEQQGADRFDAVDQRGATLGTVEGPPAVAKEERLPRLYAV